MKTIMNMNWKATTSGAHLARVALSWFMVLLKEMYLNSLSQAQNTLIARMLVEVSCQKLSVSKSPNV